MDEMRAMTSVDAANLDKELLARGANIYELMQNAGDSVSNVIQHIEDGRSQGKFTRVILVVGPGNNGGDALVVAQRLFLDDDRKVCVWVPKTPNPGSPNEELLKKLPSDCVCVGGELGFKGPFDLLVDGLFGFSFVHPPRGVFIDAILRLRQLQEAGDVDRELFTISIDVPSGFPVSGNHMNCEDLQRYWEVGQGVLPDAVVSLTAVKPISALICSVRPCRMLAKEMSSDSGSCSDGYHRQMVRPEYRHFLAQDFVDVAILNKFRCFYGESSTLGFAEITGKVIKF